MEDETVHSLHQLETSSRKLHDFARSPSHHSQQTGKLNSSVSFHQNQLPLATIRKELLTNNANVVLSLVSWNKHEIFM